MYSGVWLSKGHKCQPVYFGVWVSKGLECQPAALIETFARFQAGFLSSEDVHRIPSILVVFYRFRLIFIDFHGCC